MLPKKGQILQSNICTYIVPSDQTLPIDKLERKGRPRKTNIRADYRGDKPIQLFWFLLLPCLVMKNCQLQKTINFL
jgi:hypothetical protein